LLTVEAALVELRRLAETPDAPADCTRVRYAVTGGAGRVETASELARLAGNADAVADIAPSTILRRGLPITHAKTAIILDTELVDVPDRYRDLERARRLVGVVIDAVEPGDLVIVPAKEWELQDRAREEDCVIAIFSTADDVTARDRKVADVVGFPRAGRIVIERGDVVSDGGLLRADLPVASQVAAALATL
jgi:hypothetical protein